MLTTTPTTMAVNHFGQESGQKSVYKTHLLSDRSEETAALGIQLSRRYEQLLRLEKYTDCVFHICDTQVKCHKLILSAASPVFEAMFYGALREHEREIEIHDISPEMFKTLIDYIYIGRIDFEQLMLEDVIELYYAAEKYLLTGLTTDCLLAMRRKLRFSNILPALELTVYMNLTSLFDVCVAFFIRCCVNNTQFMKYFKDHYVHVSKDCVKAVIAACKETHKLLFWFVYEWTQQECLMHGLQQCESALIIDELQLPDARDQLTSTEASKMTGQQQQQLVMIERCYYKACRPFTVDSTAHVWRVRLKSERFISLTGLVLNSRLAPLFTNAWVHQHAPVEYNETMRIDLRVVRESEPVEAAEQPDANFIWSHVVQKQCTKYNCDLNINWREGVVLTPDVLYELQFSWDPCAYGAEYPCSLQSCLVNGIKFIDGDTFSGSLLKGLRYMNLV